MMRTSIKLGLYLGAAAMALATTTNVAAQSMPKKDMFQDVDEQLAKGDITPEQAAKLRKTAEGVQRNIADQADRDAERTAKDIKETYGDDQSRERLERLGEVGRKTTPGQSADGKTVDPEKFDPSLTDRDIAEGVVDASEMGARGRGKLGKGTQSTIETGARGIDIYTQERNEYIQNNPNASAQDKKESARLAQKVKDAVDILPGVNDRKAREAERDADRIRDNREEYVKEVEKEIAKWRSTRKAEQQAPRNQDRTPPPPDAPPPPPESDITGNEAEPPAEPGGATPAEPSSQASTRSNQRSGQRGTIPPKDPEAEFRNPEQKPPQQQKRQPKTKPKPQGQAQAPNGPRGNASRRAGVDAAITQQESQGTDPDPLAEALNEINRPQGKAGAVALNAAGGAAAAIIDPAILQKLGRAGKAGSGGSGGSATGDGSSGPAISGRSGAFAAAGAKGAAQAGADGNFLSVSPLDITPFNVEPVRFKPVQWKPIEFKPPRPLEIQWSQFDRNAQYPGGANNLAYSYASMSGRIATDLGPWREWLATQNIAYLEQLARAGGYPNLAAALADSRNLLRRSRDTGFRQWAWGPSVSSGSIGIWASDAQHNLGRAQVLLGDLLQQSRAFESTGGLSDIAITGLDLQYMLRDFGLEDGDTVDIRLEQFGRTIFSTRLSLLNAGTDFRQLLRPGVARLVITAVNEGAISPNTAEINVNNVVRGNGQQTYSLTTGETATLRIETNAVRGN